VVAQRAPLADAHTVEGTDDRVGQAVLLVRAAGEELGRELLESIGGAGRRAGQLRALWRWKHRRALEDHAAGDHGDLPQPSAAERVDRGAERRGAHAFLLRSQPRLELVEVS